MISFSMPPKQWLEDIPSFIDGDRNIDKATVEAFGDEWNQFATFSETEIDYIASEYFDILPAEKLKNFQNVLDLGCGSGRWSMYLAKHVGFVEAVDPSAACLVARRNTASFPNVRVSQASASTLPFPDDSFDLAICLGVLHHVPNTAQALLDLTSKIKPGGTLLLYLYYDLSNRSTFYQWLHTLSEYPRRVISKMPLRMRNIASDTMAVVVYFPLIVLAKIVDLVNTKTAKSMPLYYYTNKSWNVIRNDARDRFGTPLEQRFSKEEIINMLHTAGMSDVSFSNNAPYWHCTAIKE